MDVSSEPIREIEHIAKQRSKAAHGKYLLSCHLDQVIPPSLTILCCAPKPVRLSIEVHMAQFPFSDLHSFKDYVGFVRLCAPDMFPVREGVSTEDQWSLELAFRGLREGLKLSIAEKGPKQVFSDCEKLVDDAYDEYRAGHIREGSFKLEEVRRLLRKVPSE